VQVIRLSYMVIVSLMYFSNDVDGCDLMLFDIYLLMIFP
jgi:hypothetical protein